MVSWQNARFRVLAGVHPKALTISLFTRSLQQFFHLGQILSGEGKVGFQVKCFPEVLRAFLQFSPSCQGRAEVVVHGGVVGNSGQGFLIMVVRLLKKLPGREVDGQEVVLMSQLGHEIGPLAPDGIFRGLLEIEEGLFRIAGQVAPGNEKGKEGGADRVGEPATRERWCEVP